MVGAETGTAIIRAQPAERNPAYLWVTSCLKALLVPAQRNEPDGNDVTYLDLTCGKLLNHSQNLDGGRITHRDDHASARLQLFDQRLGDVLGPCRDKDTVERALLGPSEVPVSGTDHHVRNSQALEAVGR